MIEPIAGLSLRQKELLSRQLADPATCALNIGSYCEIRGPLDPARFRIAIEGVVAGFDALRAVLRAGVREPAVVWLDTLAVPLAFADVANEADASAWIGRDMQRPFVVYDTPLYRLALLRITDTHWRFYSGFHHALVDGWAIYLITARVLAEYDALGGGAAVDALYASERVLFNAQASYVASPAFERDAAFWRARLAGHPGPLLRKLREDGAGGGKQVVMPVCLPRAVLAALLERAGVGKDAEAPVLLALLYGFFGLAAARDDIVFGMSLLNRRGPEELNAAGLAASAVPLRMHGGFAKDLASVVRMIARELRSVYRHHRFPLNEMTRLHAQGAAATGCLFDVSVSFLVKPYAALRMDGALVGRQTQVYSSDAQAPMQVFVDAHDPAAPVYIDFLCDTAYFDADTLARLPARLLAYAGALATAPTLGSAARIDAMERRELIAGWNATAVAAEFLPLHVRVARWAQSSPQRPALVTGRHVLTYAELACRVDTLAAGLDARGIGLECKVGVLLPRGPELPIAMLAIQRAGGVYVPLDPDAPPERLGFVLADADVQLLLTTRGLGDRFGNLGVAACYLDAIGEAPGAVTEPPLARTISPRNLAYLIYTSGSTGKPKGVGLTHGGLSNLGHALQQQFRICGDDAVLQFARACFDASVFEMAAAFANGAALHPVDAYAARSPDALAALLIEQRIAMATLPPSLLPSLSHHRFPALKTLVVAGEACSADTAALWRARCHLINAYGPTETTVCATFAAVDTDGIPPIGKPLINTQTYVLDAVLEPVPIGETGTLYVGGDALARGYLKRPGLSAERFVADPFGHPGGRLYRTDDIVRHRADGALEFLGRADQQIKLRGFRIELGEVEAALRACADVADAVVTSHRHASGESTLVAYCVIRAGELPLATLRAQLAATLPGYMVPAQFVQLAALPLNANGKVARKALPAPAAVAIVERGPVNGAGSVESSLEAIWTELLHLPRVGIDVQFFEVGGSSLLLGQVLQAIETGLGVKLEIIDLIKHPTIRSLAQHVRAMKQNNTPGGRGAAAKPFRPRGVLAALGLRK